MHADHHIIKLATAYPDLLLQSTAKKRTFRGRLGLEDGTVKNAYIKLLSITELSREAFVSVLGRRLALPIPEPFYVYVDPTYVGEANISNMHGTAFALEAEQLPNQRIMQKDVLQNIGDWTEVFKCAAFDALIANRDRLPHNILYAGNKGYWLIDHEEALPSHLSPSDAVGTQLCQKISESKSDELEVYRIRDKMLAFIDNFSIIDWDEIRMDMRFDEFPEIRIDCDHHILMIQNRIPHMRDILSKELNIKQREMKFGNRSKFGKEKTI